ncbi:hypothetical protein LX87_05693 [Larkinella arboricola]|uniref:Uncharacterized protein n=1 Tax=Larkinella arboricola TaxID=643671 RepID=A0A327WJ58_LARAB|nr:hypothetical protein [Larkinella arboricola]RAJ89756.1 hypothetical protein LX87_05693 [Larkinella arboricola]
MADSKSNFITIVVAVIGWSGTIIAALIASQKSNLNSDLEKELVTAKQSTNQAERKLTVSVQQHDSLINSYNDLVKRYNALPCNQENTGELKKQEDLSPSTPLQEEDIFPLPTISESRQGQHYLQIKRVVGNSKTKLVTVKFLSTNERYDGSEYLYMLESIGTFQGKTYYAIRGKLGDKKGEGQDQYTTPGMQTVAGDPTYAEIIMNDVPTTVSKFSTLIININGDRVSLKNVPITWQ